MKKLKYSLFIIAYLFVYQVSAQVDSKHLDSYIQQAVKEYELPGLAISLVKDGDVEYQKAFGFENEPKQIPLKTNSTFGIASLSKAFTATAIAMLVDDGKLKWDDKVSRHLKYFKLSDDYVASQLTVEDLLAHRSGFDTFDGDLLWYGTNYSREEIIKRFSKYPMTYDFRTSYGYQNIMFIIAGEIVEEVSGMSWDAFIESRIFKPLGMNNSYTSINQFKSETSVAMPHVKGELDELRNYDNSGGAAALSSNVEDLSLWIKFWLNDGIVGNDTLLKAETHRKLLRLHTPIPTSSFDRKNGIEFKGYSQGWFLMDYDGDKVAHHGGGLPGYISKLFIVPSQKIGGIILSNGETSLPAAMMYKAIDVLKGNENGPDWAGTYLAFSKRYEKHLAKKVEERVAARNPKLKSNVDPKLLVGIYEDKVYGKAEVKFVGKELQFTMLASKEIFTSKMTHWQQNTYEIKFKDKFLPNGYLTFNVNANGEVVNLKVDLPNPDFHFHNLDFVKQK
ncbi:MAG: serine hydrolase [Flavobacteriales bacterium]|nr:serine hydrolase [Flavobacteriales bacterium]